MPQAATEFACEATNPANLERANSVCFRAISAGDTMKKPINKFAVALWLFAALVVAGEAAQYLNALEYAKTLASHGDRIYMVESAPTKAIFMSLLGPAQLAAFGYLIELVDQIRWNALQRQK
jgi:hypothetical protein